MCHRSASLLRRQHLSKLETGAGFRGWCQAASLLSCECLGGRQGTLPFALPSATAYELLLPHMLLCIKCGHQACGHVCITSLLIVFSLRNSRPACNAVGLYVAPPTQGQASMSLSQQTGCSGDAPASALSLSCVQGECSGKHDVG